MRIRQFDASTSYTNDQALQIQTNNNNTSTYGQIHNQTSRPWLHPSQSNTYKSEGVEQGNTALTMYKGRQPFRQNNPKQPFRQNSQTQCHYCKKNGHIFRACRKRIADQRRGTSFITQEYEQEEEDTMFMILAVLEDNTNQRWLIDSGCSNHNTGERKLFINSTKHITKK